MLGACRRSAKRGRICQPREIVIVSHEMREIIEICCIYVEFLIYFKIFFCNNCLIFVKICFLVELMKFLFIF